MRRSIRRSPGAPVIEGLSGDMTHRADLSGVIAAPAFDHDAARPMDQATISTQTRMQREEDDA